MKFPELTIVVTTSLFLSSAWTADEEPKPAKAESAKLSFVKDIKPIIREKCSHCHNRKTLPDRPGFENAKSAFVKTEGGLSIIVPGEPDKSLMIVAIQSNRMHEGAMPMVGERPTEEEVAKLRQWIKEGADWPKGWKGKIKPPFYAKE